MRDTSIDSKLCVPGINCGNEVLSLIFFISFIIIMQYIMLNLFILILVQEMEINYLNKNNALHDFKAYENAFQEVWAQYCHREDPFKLNSKLLVDLYTYLESPLGIGFNQQMIEWKEKESFQLTNDEIENQTRIIKKNLKSQAAKLIMFMSMRLDEWGFVYYNEVFYLFFRQMMKEDLQKNVSQQGIEIVKKAEDQMLKKLWKLRNKITFKIDREVAENTRSYNPLITILFVRMAFKSWNRFSKIFEHKRQVKQHEDLQQHFLIEIGQVSSHSSEELNSKPEMSSKLEKTHNTSEYSEYIIPQHGIDERLDDSRTPRSSHRVSLNPKKQASNLSDQIQMNQFQSSQRFQE